MRLCVGGWVGVCVSLGGCVCVRVYVCRWVGGWVCVCMFVSVGGCDGCACACGWVGGWACADAREGRDHI